MEGIQLVEELRKPLPPLRPHDNNVIYEPEPEEGLDVASLLSQRQKFLLYASHEDVANVGAHFVPMATPDSCL